MVCGRHGEEVGNCAPETAARLAESESGSDASAIRRAAAKSSVFAGGAGSARYLEGHEDSITTPPLANLVADGHDLGDSFVAESKRSRKESSRRHGKIEVAPCHRERPHDGASRTGHDGIRMFSPLHTPRLNERQLAHEAQCSPGSNPAGRRVTLGSVSAERSVT